MSIIEDAAETVDLIEPWIYSQIVNDAQIMALIGGEDRVSGTMSTDDPTVPYISILMQSTRDIQGNAGSIIANESLYQVKVVDATGSWDDLIPVAARLKAVLHHPGECFTVPGGSLSCIRERVIQYPEKVKGVQYRHLGASWRIRASRDN